MRLGTTRATDEHVTTNDETILTTRAHLCTFFFATFYINLLILSLRALHFALSASEDILGRWFRRR
jgi:hypothetical protein